MSKRRGIFREVMGRLGFVHRDESAASARAYAAARISRLTSDWVMSALSPAEEVRGGIKTARERARTEERDNDHVRRYLRVVEKNVVGPGGALLQAQVLTAAGKPDVAANAALEEGWRQWGRKGVCTADGQLSWLGVQRVAMRTVKRDGESLVRLLRGWGRNRFGFAVQLLEPDLLDHEYDAEPRGGSPRVRMGVELDEWQRPTAYHLFTAHPGDLRSIRPRDRVRVPASDLLHIYTVERAGQVRGVTALCSALRRLHMLHGYEEAEVVAARAASCKMGVYERGMEYQGDGKDEDGTWMEDAEPGSHRLLPVGVTYKPVDPQHPTSQYPAFVGACLKGAASGLDISYAKLTSDLAEANYSSMRVGNLDDQDGFGLDQAELLIEGLSWPVYFAWLEMALLTQAVRLPASQFDRLSAATWQPRTWSSVDPEKDARAAEIAEDRRWVSPRQNAASYGNDREDVFADIATDAEMAARYKVMPTVRKEAPSEPAASA
jgi:lambda family phage portal protein